MASREMGLPSPTAELLCSVCKADTDRGTSDQARDSREPTVWNGTSRKQDLVGNRVQ